MTRRLPTWLLIPLLSGLCAWGTALGAAPDWRPLVGDYCLDCHDSGLKKGGLDLASIYQQDATAHPETWEKALRRLRARQMPPAGKDRPDEATYERLIASLEQPLDEAYRAHPQPGRTETFRRLTRFEYQNAIRDLLALDVDVRKWLPADQASHGFDNITVGDLSPTLLSRYITAAQKISRMAIGSSVSEPEGETIRLRPDITQEEHVTGLPLGTRGGALIEHTFPLDGDYEVQIRLARDRNEHVEGLKEPHELVILLDRERVGGFTVRPAKGQELDQDVDQHLVARFPATAGPHFLGVTFVKRPSSLEETKRQPYEAHFNFHRHPRLSPAIYQVSINGPYDSEGPGHTPSREQIFTRMPAGPEDEDACAREILTHLMRRAYRRPTAPDDLERTFAYYLQGKQDGGFEAGIEMALSAILVSPEFLFRIEKDPEGTKPGEVYRISDLDLASRLSFFLWGSLPDEELLATAIAGNLHQPETLSQQTRRLLADPRSRDMARNFAGQWLHLRNLESITPDLRLFPDFDDNLRQAFRTETESFFASILAEDRSVLDLLRANDTFLNERLAHHYGIPNVQGDRFRRVTLDAGSHRGGLLRQGSILTVTSYATRTSPVVRGNWILENLIGTPPPPPPPNVPALKDNTVDATLSMRERLNQHRANRACAVCHDLMDPVGFSLERFDAVGRWRETEEGRPIDVTGGLPDGSTFEGVDGLEAGLLRHPDLFASVLTEKLMTYALGRGVEAGDAPAIRAIVRRAARDDYRFSAIILGIVNSPPFNLREGL